MFLDSSGWAVISRVIFQGDVLVMDGAGVQEYYE